MNFAAYSSKPKKLSISSNTRSVRLSWPHLFRIRSITPDGGPSWTLPPSTETRQRLSLRTLVRAPVAREDAREVDGYLT